MGTDFARFNYDAAMAIGIAACEAKNDFFTAADLYESMLQTKFEGVTGQVEFDNRTGTRYLNEVQYKIFNGLSIVDPTDSSIIRFNFTESAIVELSPSGGEVRVIKDFVYADNTTMQPTALPPYIVDLNLIPKWALGVGLGFCAIMMVMSIGWGVWTYVNRKQRCVRVSQPFFLTMLCIGTLMIASAIIPASFQEPMSLRTLNAGCMLFPWLACLGFVTAFSALFTKSHRINKVSRFSCVVHRFQS